MCYGVTRLRSLKDSMIEICFYLAIELLFNRTTDVCPLCGPHDIRTVVIHKNKCIPVRYKILPIMRSYIWRLPYSAIFFSLTPLLLITRTYGHTKGCVFDAAVDTILCSVSRTCPPIFCSNLHFFHHNQIRHIFKHIDN
jgi:hypothetical protein